MATLEMSKIDPNDWSSHRREPFIIDQEPLSENDKEVALLELNEEPGRVETSLAELRGLIQKDGTLIVPINDEFLIKFLRPCKFFPRSAYKLLKRAMQFKEKNFTLLDRLMPVDEEEAFLTNQMINILPNRSKGRRILVLHLGGERWDPHRFKCDQIFRLLYLMQHAAMAEPRTQVHGVSVICSFEGLTFKQVTALGAPFYYRMTEFCQRAVPLRIREIHIVQQPIVFSIVWEIMKPFLEEKIKERTYLHGYNLQSLYDYIPKEDLPQDFGGDLPYINHTSGSWYPSLRDIDYLIQEWNECRIDSLSRRVSSSSSGFRLFGSYS